MNTIISKHGKFLILNSTLVLTLLHAGHTFAQEKIDPLKETQKVLTDKTKRDAAIKQEGSKAQAVDQYAEKIAGPQGKEEMYGLSADLMAVIEKESGGDPDKMMKILEEAQKNPEAFYNRFSPEQKAKLKAIAEKAPKPSKP